MQSRERKKGKYRCRTGILCAEAEDLECRKAATFLQEERKAGEDAEKCRN